MSVSYLIVRRQDVWLVDGDAVEDDFDGRLFGRCPPAVLLVLLEDVGRRLLGQPRVQRRRHLRRRRVAERAQAGPGPSYLRRNIVIMKAMICTVV